MMHCDGQGANNTEENIRGSRERTWNVSRQDDIQSVNNDQMLLHYGSSPPQILECPRDTRMHAHDDFTHVQTHVHMHVHGRASCQEEGARYLARMSGRLGLRDWGPVGLQAMV